jgi:hypothetical protein
MEKRPRAEHAQGHVLKHIPAFTAEDKVITNKKSKSNEKANQKTNAQQKHHFKSRIC